MLASKRVGKDQRQRRNVAAGLLNGWRGRPERPSRRAASWRRSALGVAARLTLPGAADALRIPAQNVALDPVRGRFGGNLVARKQVFKQLK